MNRRDILKGCGGLLAGLCGAAKLAGGASVPAKAKVPHRGVSGFPQVKKLKARADGCSEWPPRPKQQLPKGTRLRTLRGEYIWVQCGPDGSAYAMSGAPVAWNKDRTVELA